MSHEDIAWLCRVVDAATTYLAYGDPGPGYDQAVARHLRRALKKSVYGRDVGPILAPEANRG